MGQDIIEKYCKILKNVELVVSQRFAMIKVRAIIKWVSNIGMNT
jgi:hypothetical protein